MTFQYKIQRYRNGSSRISSTQFVNAKDFHEAFVAVDRVVLGMSGADPDSDYRIVSILSHDYRGDDCEGGGYPFETRDEFSARVAAKAKP